MATNHRPYQGYPYTDPYVTDAPSIDAATASRWADLPRRPLQTRNVVYVDIPDEEGSQVACSTPPLRQEKKNNIDDSPVIYIDVPENSSSDVAGPAEPEPEPEYVQETIFYNPFDNRRIDQGKDGESVLSSDSECSSGPRPPVRPARPTPPSSLNLSSPGSSGYSSNYPTPLPASMAKETYMYQATPGDRFPASPIPVSEFPQPPPAYTEIETPVEATGPVDTPAAPAPAEPPRTIVITPGTVDQPQQAHEPSPIGLPNPYRKVVYCHHCGLRVHTLVIRQTGAATHVVALSFLCIGLFPMTILVYLTDTCKNKNHYCPNCNKLIGYEVPILCQNMTFTK